MKKMINILIAFTLMVSFINAQDLSDYIICLDPGHGGHESDDRNMTWADFWESESNLSKAFFLDTLLKNLGATVVLTRHGNGDTGSDNDPGLSERAAVANNAGADFFHSIHSNGGNGNANYSLILYPGPTGDPRINGISGYPSSPIELTLSNQMATQIHACNRTTYKTTAGDWTFYGTGQPYLGVFRTLTLPGSLSEGSFHDYYPETYRLKNRAYHKNEAWAITRTYALVLTSTDLTTRTLAGIVRDNNEFVEYNYLNTNDSYKPIDHIVATLNPGGRVYHGDDQNNGYFMFDNLTPGTYQIKVEAEGYYPDSAEVTITTSFFNFKDFFLNSTMPPKVVSTTPTDGFVNFPAWDPIVINFNRPMDTTTVRSALTIVPAIPLTFTWSDIKSLRITSDSLKYLTEYTIAISAAALDTYGHLFDGNGDGIEGDNYSFSFTTGPEDMTPPKVASFTPIYYATDVDLYPIISLFFSEKVDSASITANMLSLIEISSEDTIPVIYRHYYVNEVSVLHIMPTEVLKAATYYKLYLESGTKDLFGNVMTTRKLLRFTTGSSQWAVTSIDNFEAGVNNWWTPGSSGSTTGIKPTCNRDVDTVYNYFGGSGRQAMKLHVDWDTTATAWLLREYLSGGSPREVTFTGDKVLQSYVFGDGSNVLFRYAVDDGSGFTGHEVSPWYTVDWLGWKLVCWNMATDGTGTWIGDGTLNGTLRIDSFQLSYDESLSSASSTIYIDDLRVVTVTSVGIAEEEPQTARKFTLHQNYPNPFNPTTTIAFTLPEASNVRIEVFNLLGERVRLLTNSRYGAGNYSVVWDGLNESGTLVPSGVYFYRMISDLGVQVRNMMLLK